MKIFISDGISFKDNKLSFNARSKENIKTTLGKKGFKPYVTTIQKEFKILSVYKKETGGDKKELLNVLSGLKKSKDSNLEDYNLLLKRAALFAYRQFKKFDIDIFLTVESSSELAVDFSNMLLNYFPNKQNILFLDNAIQKNENISNIEIEQTDKISPSAKKSLNRILNNAKKEGFFEIKKVPPRYRKFIKNWLMTTDQLNQKIFEKKILIIDDYITSGQSLYGSYKLLKNNGAADIYGLSLIKL